MSVPRRWALGCALIGASSTFACQKEEPERLPPFEGDTWKESTGRVPGGGRGDGDDEETSAGGSQDQAEQLQGRVEAFVEPQFVLKEGYSEPSSVWIIDRTRTDWVEVPYDGEAFFVDPVSASSWLAVVPEFDNEHLDTITIWDGASAPLPVVVPTIVLEEIVGGLIAADTVNSARAQLLVQVLDSDGVTGLAGVIPIISGASDIAYLDAGVWSDADEATGSSGLFLAYNVTARDMPGQDVRVILSGTIEAEFTVRLAAGVATVVSYVAP